MKAFPFLLTVLACSAVSANAAPLFSATIAEKVCAHIKAVETTLDQRDLSDAIKARLTRAQLLRSQIALRTNAAYVPSVLLASTDKKLADAIVWSVPNQLHHTRATVAEFAAEMDCR